MRFGSDTSCANSAAGVVAAGAALLTAGLACADEAADGLVAEVWYRAAIDGCLASLERGATEATGFPGYRVSRADGAFLASPPLGAGMFYVVHRGDVHEAPDETGAHRMVCSLRGSGPALGEMGRVLSLWAERAEASGRFVAAKDDETWFSLTSAFRTPRGCRLGVSYGPATDGETEFSVREVAETGCGGAAVEW